MAQVLVTDGSERSALAVVRSLGAAGHKVYVCSSVLPSLAGSSRYAVESLRTASALDAPGQFVADVRALANRYGVEVLLPVTESSASVLLAAAGTFGNAIIPMSSRDSFARICQKPLVLEAAGKLGIRVPLQRSLAAKPGRLELQRLAEELDADAAFPLVLKPSTSVVAQGATQWKVHVWHARNAAAFLTVMEQLPPAVFPLLLQERIRGSGIGVFLLLWNDQVLASFGHRRIREKPPSGGASVDRESVAVDPELMRQSVALLRAFEWQGVAMVEYKMDEKTCTPVLMEINGRFWGSLQLAIDAGVDFPVLLLEAALGRPQPPVTRYRLGVRNRWFWGDVDSLLRVLRHSPEEINIDNGVKKTRAIRDFVSASWQTRNEIFRADDPAPGLLESWSWLSRRGREACRRLLHLRPA